MNNVDGTRTDIDNKMNDFMQDKTSLHCLKKIINIKIYQMILNFNINIDIKHSKGNNAISLNLNLKLFLNEGPGSEVNNVKIYKIHLLLNPNTSCLTFKDYTLRLDSKFKELFNLVE